MQFHLVHPNIFQYDQYFIVNIQGAPEGIVDRCNFVRVGQEKLPLTPEVKAQIMKLIGEYGTGSDTLRCLALATVDEPIPRDQMDLQVYNTDHLHSF